MINNTGHAHMLRTVGPVDMLDDLLAAGVPEVDVFS
jgi:hypothetical protein